MALEPPIWFIIHARHMRCIVLKTSGEFLTRKTSYSKLSPHNSKLEYEKTSPWPSPPFFGSFVFVPPRLPSSPHKDHHLFPVGLSRGGYHHRSLRREEAGGEIAVRLMIGQAFFLTNTWVAILCLDVPLEVW